MQFTNRYDNPGEHVLTLQGLVGPLEAVLTIPEQIKEGTVALLGHPHSLQGGTMNNKVVTTMARACKERGIPSLRFNFRGVGQSAGIYDKGIGESEDMLSIAKIWLEEQPTSEFIFAGFSFGSYVAYRAATHFNTSKLITIAPPVHHYDYTELQQASNSWLIIQGDADEVVPIEQVLQFASQAVPAIPVITFTQTGHFFHGKLLDLKASLLAYLDAQV